MKRVNNLFEKIIEKDNLLLAYKKARRGKSFPETFDVNHLHNLLANGLYKVSDYNEFKIYDPKERLIQSLPFYPDRVIHHAIMNVMEPLFIKWFTHDTYNCIRGRGIHKASYKLRAALKQGEKYCLKLDIEKFYPSIDNLTLLNLLRRKIKDVKLLNLLDEIVMSNRGLPIGSYVSQYLANFYLSYFDHWVKQELKIKNYFRYCDDIVILGDDKQKLGFVLKEIHVYLQALGLKVKSNYQIFPIESRGIDWVGYVHYHTHTLLRKKIKINYIKSKNKFNYNGWLVHANCYNLRKKYEKVSNN